jgi:hypothetical protein
MLLAVTDSISASLKSEKIRKLYKELSGIVQKIINPDYAIPSPEWHQINITEVAVISNIES